MVIFRSFFSITTCASLPKKALNWSIKVMFHLTKINANQSINPTPRIGLWFTRSLSAARVILALRALKRQAADAQESGLRQSGDSGVRECYVVALSLVFVWSVIFATRSQEAERPSFASRVYCVFVHVCFTTIIDSGLSVYGAPLTPQWIAPMFFMG